MKSLVDRSCDYMAFVAAGILFFLAGLTTCDVVGRRFFDSPITGTIEIVELGMAVAAFFAMPRAFLTNSHVSADFLGHLAKGTFGVFIVLLRGSITIATVSLMAYATTVKALELMDGKRVTIELELPFFPFKAIIAIAMWWSAIAALIWMIRAISSGEAARSSGAEH
jgi:TRAP-type C4-dicarboxylate transport system permease small subunit